MNETASPRTRARTRLLIEITVGGAIALAWVVVIVIDQSRAHIKPNHSSVRTELPITLEASEMLIGSSALNQGPRVAKDYLVQRQILWIEKSRPEIDVLTISRAFEHMKVELERRSFRGEGRDVPPDEHSADGRVAVALNPTTVNQLKSGQGRFYLLRRLAWSDAAGPHVMNRCEYLDPKQHYRWVVCEAEY